MITRGELRRTLKYLDSSQAAALTEKRLTASHTKGGRPRNLPVRTLFAGIMLCYDRYSTTVMTKVYRLLTCDLDIRDQRKLGIRSEDDQLIKLNPFYYLWSEIARAYDHTAAYAPRLNPVQRAERADAWQAVIDVMTGAAGRNLPAPTALAIDETAIESWARCKRSNATARAEEAAAAAGLPVSIRCFDRDARNGHKTTTNKTETGIMFGYQCVTFTRARGRDGADQPMLLERIALVPGNDNGTEAAIDMLASLARHADADRIDEITVDRGFSYAETERWAARLRKMGIRQVFDLHDRDRGRHPHADGYVMIDGQPYCASVPDELVRIKKPLHLSPIRLPKYPTKAEIARAAARQQEIDDFNTAIANRELYRFVPHGKTTTGRRRWQCPVRAHKALPAPAGQPPQYDAAIPTIAHPAINLPKACRQQTIVIDDDTDLKLRQEDVWGSPEWQASYGRRSRAEGSHGILKGSDTGGIRRGFTRHRGLVRTGLLLGLAVMMTNLRSIERWLHRTGECLHDALTIDTASAGHIELDPDGTIGGTSPPAEP